MYLLSVDAASSISMRVGLAHEADKRAMSGTMRLIPELAKSGPVSLSDAFLVYCDFARFDLALKPST